MTGYNLSHLTLTAADRPPVVRLPKVCRGCGGIRQKHKQWCAVCYAARYPVAPPLLTQDWSAFPPHPVEPETPQIAHCGRWHAVDGLPMRLPCCGLMLEEEKA